MSAMWRRAPSDGVPLRLRGLRDRLSSLLRLLLTLLLGGEEERDGLLLRFLPFLGLGDRLRERLTSDMLKKIKMNDVIVFKK